jgi:hypothetical protein
MKDIIEYLIGYIEKDEFRCVLETKNEQIAHRYFEDSVLEDSTVNWAIYRKTISFDKIR